MALYTNVTRFTGLSGIDTESLVSSLMLAESQKLYKLQRNNSLLEWKQEAYWSVSSKLNTFQSTYLSVGTGNPKSILMGSNFKLQTAGVSYKGIDSNMITVKTGTASKTGKYEFFVDQLATKQQFESTAARRGSIKGKSDFTVADVGDKLEFKGGKLVSGPVREGDSFNITLDGTTKKIMLTADDIKDIYESMPTWDPNTLPDGDFTITTTAQVNELNAAYEAKLNEKLKDAFGTEGSVNKVEAKFVATSTGQRLDFDVAANMKGHTLSISEGTKRTVTSTVSASPITNNAAFWADLDGEKFKLEVDFDGETKEIEVDFSEYPLKGIISVTQDVAMNAINNALSTQGIPATFHVDSSKNVCVTVNGATRSDIVIRDNQASGLLDKFGIADSGFGSPTGGVSLERSNVLAWMGDIPNKATNTFGDNMTLKEMAASEGFNAMFNNPMSFKINGVEIKLDGTETVSEFMTKVNSSGAGVTMDYDTFKETFTLTSNTSGAIGAIDIDAPTGTPEGRFIRQVLRLTPAAPTVDAKDAEFTVNGVRTTRSENTFVIDSTTFTLNEAMVRDPDPTKNDPVIINIVNDPTSSIEMISEFVLAYNDLIDEINAMVNERKVKSGDYGKFEPLTPDEKKEMTEKEIELWEEKAKQGILARDSILSGITQQMRSWMYQSVEVGSDGTKLSLSQIGITTTKDYKSQGKLMIDIDKLNAAYEKYGDDVNELFHKMGKDDGSGVMKNHGIGYRMQSIVRDAVGPSGTLTKKVGEKDKFSETDSDMYKEIRDYGKKINNMLSYLTRKETYYYNMFSKMEAAMMKSESDLSYLTSMLGM